MSDRDHGDDDPLDDLPIERRQSPRARRISLRIDPTRRMVRLTRPDWISHADADEFARSHADWIRRRLARLPEPIPFVDGVEIPLLGVPHRVVHSGRLRGVAEVEDGTIVISGPPEHLSRRLTDWLKRRAGEEIRPRAVEMAGWIDRRVSAVSLRDTRSRWGSCTSSGRLSFSWRLVLAPEEILNYVVAHEVAHLQEMNHGPKFWRWVETLDPDFRNHRGWLTRHGQELWRYG